MSRDELKRRGASHPPAPAYPAAEEIKQNRRHFLGLIGKGLLGASVLGSAGCFSKGPAAGQDASTGDDAQDADAQGSPKDTHFVLGGAVAAPDTLAPLKDAGSAGDTSDEPDWILSGGAPMPDAQEPSEDANFGPGGVMRQPDAAGSDASDATDAKDAGDTSETDSGFPPMAGDMPMPDAK